MLWLTELGKQAWAYSPCLGMFFLGLGLALAMRILVNREIRRGRREDSEALDQERKRIWNELREQLSIEAQIRSLNGRAGGPDGGGSNGA